MSRGYWHEKELADRSETDWIFGGLSQPGIVSIPLAEREQWLPIGEVQNQGEEKYWCATASPINALAALFSYHYAHNMHPENKKWLEDNGYVQNGRVDFSDAFNAILSGTTRQGNSLIAPLQSIHSDGCVPKFRLPQLYTWDETYDPKRISTALKDLGLEFSRRFTVNYERVSEVHVADVLKDDMVGVALYGWSEPINGVYPRTSEPLNHAVLFFKPRYFAFDNYNDEGRVGDFIKQLAPDYDLNDTAYRVFISKEDPNATAKQLSLYQQLIQVLTKIRDIIRGA